MTDIETCREELARIQAEIVRTEEWRAIVENERERRQADETARDWYRQEARWIRLLRTLEEQQD